MTVWPGMQRVGMPRLSSEFCASLGARSPQFCSCGGAPDSWSVSAPSCAQITPLTRPSSTRKSSTNVLNRTSPPRRLISSRIFLTTRRSTSVPICGFCLYKISFGAPAATNSSSTLRIRASLIPVVSLPSLKVPAPPSPNCTLDCSFSVPSRQKRSTDAVLASTSCPRSSTSGRSPACAKISAANIPAGPKPTMIGRSRKTRADGKGSGIPERGCGVSVCEVGRFLSCCSFRSGFAFCRAGGNGSSARFSFSLMPERFSRKLRGVEGSSARFSSSAAHISPS